jgi:hypothetical protein
MTEKICRNFGKQGDGAGQGAAGAGYPPEVAVGIMRRRLARILFRNRFWPFCSAAFFIVGLLILGGRFLLPGWTLTESLVLAGVAAVAACGAAAYRVWRLLPDRRKLLVYLESASGSSGGLLSTGLERELGSWNARIRPLALPDIHGRLKYGLPAWLAALVFLGGTVWCPVQRFDSLPSGALQVTEELEALQEKLEVLEDEVLIPAGEAAELKNALAELRDDNDAERAGRTYELLDKLTRRIDSAGAEAGTRLEESVEALGTLETAARTLAEFSAGADFKELSKEFGEILKKLAAADPAMADLLKQMAAAGMDPNNLTPEAMNKLAEAMKQMSQAGGDALRKLCDAGLIKKQLAGNRSGLGRRAVNEAALKEWLEQQARERGGLCGGVCPFPGSGTGQGIARGRADADLHFTGQTQDDGGERRPVRLDHTGEADQSVLLVSFTAPPGENEEVRPAVAGNLQGGDAIVEQRQSTIRPEHRAAVEQYFKTRTQPQAK